MTPTITRIPARTIEADARTEIRNGRSFVTVYQTFATLSTPTFLEVADLWDLLVTTQLAIVDMAERLLAPHAAACEEAVCQAVLDAWDWGQHPEGPHYEDHYEYPFQCALADLLVAKHGWDHDRHALPLVESPDWLPLVARLWDDIEADSYAEQSREAAAFGREIEADEADMLTRGSDL